ncbi:hypothetical protein PsorP6_004371 [Peronosclerospora sorghi]|uniref:Uncharacterized protein n=1 Tax=Peronosclerospora sorghi TaxID=230839 RepID=A0ACC0VKN7_9STRA|nr:hypothetical protein PsorP6_004371 [Peronosclerospora sorghi]
MLMNADALLFQSPLQLWETEKYRSTDTLFSNDRIVETNFSMAFWYRPAYRPNITAIDDYPSKETLIFSVVFPHSHALMRQQS